jgi:hypothetical protein
MFHLVSSCFALVQNGQLAVLKIFTLAMIASGYGFRLAEKYTVIQLDRFHRKV